MRRLALVLSLLTYSTCQCPSKASDEPKPKPISFSAVNKSGKAVYLNWTSGPKIFTCSVRKNGKWEDCRFFPPSCMRTCSGKNKNEDCCIHCGPPRLAVKALGVGATNTVHTTWSAETWKVVTDHCAKDCPCVEGRPAPNGHYRVSLCVHALDCPTCVVENGEVKAGSVTDRRAIDKVPFEKGTCFATEFDIPSDGHVVITIK